MSNDTKRTTQEIHDFIKSGMNEKVLDFDRDWSVTALGDGLMVIRKLFGAAFVGAKLTDKAISNDATRIPAEIHEYIAAMSTLDTIAWRNKWNAYYLHKKEGKAAPYSAKTAEYSPDFVEMNNHNQLWPFDRKRG